jgi:phosphonate metabolism-associated iron-containing alcohol dehydrogenase
MDTQTWTWQLPVALRFGPGALSAVAAELGGRPCVVLALEPAEALGWRDTWTQALGRSLVGWLSVPEGLSTVSMARQLSIPLWPLLARPDPPVLVALGGGSVMDLAKFLRCRPEGHDFEALAAAVRRREAWPPLQRAPLWLVPTTAATGSEVTRWATLWDTDSEAVQKLSFDEDFGWADRAFVDPELSASCPVEVMRDGALDALAHALEAIWNRHANPVSDALAMSAASRILAILPQALAQPLEPAWRAELSLAALTAGIAFSQTRTALAHALSYAVTLEQGLPHGRACAIWLPMVWRLAIGISPPVDHRLGQLFACPADEGAARLEHWLMAVGVSPSPQAHGVADAAQRVIQALSSDRGRTFIGSMRPGQPEAARPPHNNINVQHERQL